MKRISLLLLATCLCITTAVYAGGTPKSNTDPNAHVLKFKVSAADLHMKTKKNQLYSYYMCVNVFQQTSPNWNYPEQIWTWWVTDMYGNTITVPISGAYITLHANCGSSFYSYDITLPFIQGTTVETETHNVMGFSSYSDTYVNAVSITTYSPTSVSGYSIGAEVQRQN